MADTDSDLARPVGPIGRVLFLCSFVFVLIGGLLMSAITVMTVVSVLGRYLISAPISGDFELVTMGTAISVFLFLPYCHLRRGNVVIDVFLSWAPRRVQTFLDGVSGLLLAAIAAMLAWRMTYGGLDMYQYNEVSYILALPVWPVFPIAVAALALLSAASLYTAVRDFREITR